MGRAEADGGAVVALRRVTSLAPAKAFVCDSRRAIVPSGFVQPQKIQPKSAAGQK